MMKTPAELIADLGHTLGEMEDDCLATFEYAGLLSVLSAGPDAETAMDGIHRLMLEIRERANNLRMKQDEAWQIVKRLANP
jgi:hypothetical protein